MVEFTYTIQDEMGLHARPAGVMVKRLKDLSINVTIKCGQRSANAKKLFQIMGMAVKCGETVTVELEGENEETMRDELLQFFKDNY